MYPSTPPGERLAYSPLANHVLMGEALRRTDPQKRRYRDIVTQDLLNPLKMKDTSVGLRADLKARKVVPDFRGNYPIGHRGHSNLGPNGAFEEENAEMPWVGIASTVPDMFRLAECLRLGGTLEGARILSPATLALAHAELTPATSRTTCTPLAARSAAGPKCRATSASASACAGRR